MSAPMLRLSGVRSGYPGQPVLRGVDLTVEAGQIIVVSGHNAAGKTTLIATIAGHVPTSSGRIRVNGDDVTGWPAHRRARHGIGLVPQGRRLFGSLTVAEHLTFTGADVNIRTAVLDRLPQLAGRLRHRPAQLSGGEQQMLSIARALTARPRLLLLDEPAEGLAPAVVDTLLSIIGDLAAAGAGVLFTEHHSTVTSALPVGQRRLDRGALTAIDDSSPKEARA